MSREKDTAYTPNKVRTVTTTKTEGWVKLRYTPKEPKYNGKTG